MACALGFFTQYKSTLRLNRFGLFHNRLPIKLIQTQKTLTMRAKINSLGEDNLSRAIHELIDRSAADIGCRSQTVQQNPANGEAGITPFGSDCEDGMYQLRWRVP